MGKRFAIAVVRRARGLVSGGLVLSLAFLGAFAAPAGATFDGENGPIAFTRIPDPDVDRAQIFSKSPGDGIEQLTHRRHYNWFPDFSPDGSKVLYTHTNFDGSDPDALFAMDADGSDSAPLASGCAGECLGDSSAAFGPDGEEIVFERAFGPIVNDAATAVNPYIADADGTDDVLVPVGLEGWEAHDSQLSPDGERIAVNMLHASDAPGFPSAIYVLGRDGSDLDRITPLRLNAGSPDWSPDGQRIVFNSSYEGQTQAEIYTVRPDGTGLHRVHREPDGWQAFEAVFSPNGERIAFVRFTGHLPHIWTMNADGTHLRQLTRGRSIDRHPDWGSE